MVINFVLWCSSLCFSLSARQPVNGKSVRSTSTPTGSASLTVTTHLFGPRTACSSAAKTSPISTRMTVSLLRTSVSNTFLLCVFFPPAYPWLWEDLHCIFQLKFSSHRATFFSLAHAPAHLWDMFRFLSTFWLDGEIHMLGSNTVQHSSFTSKYPRPVNIPLW